MAQRHASETGGKLKKFPVYQILAAMNWALTLQSTEKLLKAQLAYSYRVVHIHMMLKKRIS